MAADREHLDFLRRLLEPDVSLEQTQAAMVRRHFQGRAAASTVKALAYALRERGRAALDRAVNRQRLAQLSEDQLKELIARMRREQSKYPAAPITDALLCFLAEGLP